MGVETNTLQGAHRAEPQQGVTGGGAGFYNSSNSGKQTPKFLRDLLQYYGSVSKTHLEQRAINEPQPAMPINFEMGGNKQK